MKTRMCGLDEITSRLHLWNEGPKEGTWKWKYSMSKNSLHQVYNYFPGKHNIIWRCYFNKHTSLIKQLIVTWNIVTKLLPTFENKNNEHQFKIIIGNWRIKNQLDVTNFIVLLIGSTCFGHYYAHHQELASIMLITTFVVSFLVRCRLEVSCG